MRNVIPVIVIASLPALFTQCTRTSANGAVPAVQTTTVKAIEPAVVTETVTYDTDDPAIWINKADPAGSLIIGTDKDASGALYVFDLNGKIIQDKTVKGLQRPDNVDIEYGLNIGGHENDIAVVTERNTHKIRIYSIPSMQAIDNGGIEVFVGEAGDMARDLMGIALYKDPTTSDIYAIVGRKTGPSGEYLWQYKLEDNGKNGVKATLVRKFGQYSGKKEIESIAVDDKLGYVYYSDEGVGVRKYYADPKKGNEELALFATTGFAADHEGISIYEVSDSTGYVLVSDQGANQFFIFPREGNAGNPNDHPLKKVVLVKAMESDGSDVTSVHLNDKFSHGLFVVMSTDKTFHYYRWEDIAGTDLKQAGQ
ncbi:MAG: phytase [Bacteroidota bacterium]